MCSVPYPSSLKAVRMVIVSIQITTKRYVAPVTASPLYDRDCDTSCSDCRLVLTPVIPARGPDTCPDRKVLLETKREITKW